MNDVNADAGAAGATAALPADNLWAELRGSVVLFLLAILVTAGTAGLLNVTVGTLS